MFDILKKTSNQVTPVNSGIKPVVLLVLDGWGIAPESPGNAIELANTPNMDGYLQQYPHSELIAAGESVGLPGGEVGNSEVGHLTIGAGRMIPQSLKRIDQAILDGSFREVPALYQVMQHLHASNGKLHLMGMVGSGEVHSATQHMWELIEWCRQQRVAQVHLHLFTDGRDSPPQEAGQVIPQIEAKLKAEGVGQIVTISGRYYAMDRDKRWERTEKAYKAMVLGQGQTAGSAAEAVQAAYAKGQTDEFIEPFVVTTPQGKPAGLIDDNDAVIFFNFRIDRPRQLTMACVLPQFEQLEGFEFGFDPYKTKYEAKHGEKEVYSGKTFDRVKWPKNLFFATMTEYQPNLPVKAILFPTPKVEECLSELLAKQNLKQLHLAESEKERMVTYYFDGLREERFANEDLIVVPSPKVATYDKKPEMSVWGVVEELKQALAKGIYPFVVVNFANPDMVAHTGNLKAAIKACEITDQAIGEVVKTVLTYQGIVGITADHGNAEDLLTFSETSFYFTTGEGKVNTEHSNHPVPFMLIGPGLQGKAMAPKGTLADVAPTLLKLMNLTQPAVMTGKNLLE